MKIKKIIRKLNSNIKNKKKIYVLKKISKKKYLKKNLILFLKYFNKIILNKSSSFLITGTGGDEKYTFNISSVLSIIFSNFFYRTYKYGSSSFSSKSGSVDFFKRIKLNLLKLELIPSFKVFKNIKKINILRKIIKKKTIFNYIFPFVNPTNSRYNIIGSCSNFLHEIFRFNIDNSKFILIIGGFDLLDEITIFDKSKVTLIYKGFIKSFVIDLKFLSYKNFKSIKVRNTNDSIKIFKDIIFKKNNSAINIIISNLLVVLNMFFKKKNYFFFLKNIFKTKILKFLNKIIK